MPIKDARLFLPRSHWAATVYLSPAGEGEVNSATPNWRIIFPESSSLPHTPTLVSEHKGGSRKQTSSLCYTESLDIKGPETDSDFYASGQI